MNKVCDNIDKGGSMVQKENHQAISKYIERHYELNKMSIEEYLEIRKKLSQPEEYTRVIEENSKAERFSSLIRKRIDLSKTTVQHFDEIIVKICSAETENEIFQIMSEFNLN